MLAWVPPALISGPDPLSFLVLGILAGLLALDDTAFAQTWFGQPLPAAILTGYLFGDPLTGLAIGLPLQLVLAGNLPVGQTFTGDPTSAAVAAVAGVLMSGQTLAPGMGAGSLGSWQLMGWVILGAAFLSLVGHLFIQTERKANGLLMLEGHHSLRDGRLERIERLHVRCYLTTFGRGVGSGILFTVLLLKLWIPLFDQLPLFFRTALGLLPLLLPALGVGTLIDRYGLKSSWHWAGLGLIGTFLVARLWV